MVIGDCFGNSDSRWCVFNSCLKFDFTKSFDTCCDYSIDFCYICNHFSWGIDF